MLKDFLWGGYYMLMWGMFLSVGLMLCCVIFDVFCVMVVLFDFIVCCVVVFGFVVYFD